MDYKAEYERWLKLATDSEINSELKGMDDVAVEDAFYRNLAFGTGGLRGTIGAGTNRMNIYVVAKASQGLSDYLLKTVEGQPGVVVGYDSRIKSDLFAKVAASVFAANGLKVWIWPTLNPVPTVSFAIRDLKASQGIMITASHNPAKYNGYKVYGADGCQITTEAAATILSEIEKLDIFADVKTTDFDGAVADGKIEYIPDSVMDGFIEAVKSQSVLFGDEIDKNVTIVYSPLNGTGLKPVTRALAESGFTNIIVVEEQRNPDGNFPTCPYPNPEIREAMELGLQYCEKTGADLLFATDIKTIVTMDLAEKIASHYGVETVNVLTGFEFIGEVIGRMEAKGRESDYICGFEESYGYLTGSYVRDKDAVNAAFIIAEMFAFYKTRGISLIDKLNELYKEYGYCLNTLHSFEFPGSAGMEKMGSIMESFHQGLDSIAGQEVIKTEDYSKGLNGLPKSDVLKFYTKDISVVVRPSGTEPKLKTYVSVVADNRENAKAVESEIMAELSGKLS